MSMAMELMISSLELPGTPIKASFPNPPAVLVSCQEVMDASFTASSETVPTTRLATGLASQ